MEATRITYGRKYDWENKFSNELKRWYAELWILYVSYSQIILFLQQELPLRFRFHSQLDLFYPGVAKVYIFLPSVPPRRKL